MLHTGDLGRLDADGRVVVLGRADDMIISGGENVSPLAVEAVLERIPPSPRRPCTGAPTTMGAGGRRDDRGGPGTRPDAREVLELLRERLAPWEVPKDLRVAPELPRTASGKLLRRAL